MDPLTQFLTNANDTGNALTDFVSEVRNAKTYAFLTLGLLAYIAIKVSK